MTQGIIFFFILLSTFGFGGYSFYRVSALLKQTQREWASLDVALRLRKEIVKNISSAAIAFTGDDREFCNALSRLIIDVDPQYNIEDRAQEETSLSHALTSFFTLADLHKDLKGSEDFQAAFKSLLKCEKGITQAAASYNNAVRDYNTLINIFPINLGAKMFDFDKCPFFTFEGMILAK